METALGDIEKVRVCIDSVTRVNPLILGNYSYVSPHNYAGYLLQYGHSHLIPDLVSYLASKSSLPEHLIYKEIFDRGVDVSSGRTSNFDGR